MLSAWRTTNILLLFAAASMSVLCGCGGPPQRAVAIRFELHQGSSDNAVGITDVRFYVHGVELLDREGGGHALLLDSVSPARSDDWQNDQIALVDLTGATADERNTVVRGVVHTDTKELRGLRFSVGVPFAFNHVNPLTAPPPLNRADLFWNWQTGYKFLRVDIEAAGRVSAFHLGSTGCSSASALRPPMQPCAQPNVMRIEFDEFDPARDVVRLNLSAIAAALQASNGVACTGEYAHVPACAAAYAATGLSLDTGLCDGDVCAAQTLFRVSP